MNKLDPALTFSYPRILAALFFGLLSVVGTILIDALLTTIGIEEIVPLFKSIILGMIVASITGALCGKKIIHCPKPYVWNSFLIGFLMVILSLPFFVFGLEVFMSQSEIQIIKISNFLEFFSSYFIILGYSYLLFGFILAIMAGLSSVYLRSKFVYYVQHHDKKQSHQLPQYIGLKKMSSSRKNPFSKRKKTD